MAVKPEDVVGKVPIGEGRTIKNIEHTIDNILKERGSLECGITPGFRITQNQLRDLGITSDMFTDRIVAAITKLYEEAGWVVKFTFKPFYISFTPRKK